MIAVKDNSDIERKQDYFLAQITSMFGNIPNMETGDIVQSLHDFSYLHKVTKEFEDTLKEEIKARTDSGGKDSKGHAYFQNNGNKVKVEQRVSFKLLPDATEKLKEQDHLEKFPMKPNPEKMLNLLIHDLKVDMSEFGEPDVTLDTLTELVENNEISEEFAKTLVEAKLSYAVKIVAEKKGKLDDKHNPTT